MRSLLAISICLLTGCASVTVQRLSPDLKSAAGEPGLIYYLPAPYLIVAELPPTAVPTTQAPAVNPQNPRLEQGLAPPQPPQGAAAPEKPATPNNNGKGKALPHPVAPVAGPQFAAPGAAAPKGTSPDDPSSANGSTPPPAATTDTNFQATTPQYIVKLVYLPDMSRPMAMSARVGIGSTEMKPVLQDGWMLTSLDATADSKTAETLTALASVIPALMGGGAAKAATTATKAAPGGGPPSAGETKIPKDLSGLFVPGSHILKPGLYKFVYNELGALSTLQEIVQFTGCGTVAPAQQKTLAAVLKQGSTDCSLVQ